MRVLITGGPRTGKTTLALQLAKSHNNVMHGDDTIELGWSEASLEISHWMDEPGSWVIEGVQVPRAIRKWLNRSANRDDRTRKPADLVVFMTEHREGREKRHEAMEKGVLKVWREVKPELERRNVKIVEVANAEDARVFE